MKLATNTFLVLAFAACHLAVAEPMIVDAVAADVGGRHITVAEVMEAARDSISAEGAISATALAEKLPGAYALPVFLSAY